VINTNLPILHRFRDIAFDMYKIAIFVWLPLLRLISRWRRSLRHIIASDISLKTTFGLHFCRWKFAYIFNHFYAVRRESYQIRWNNAK